jgi:hypothetical protein
MFHAVNDRAFVTRQHNATAMFVPDTGGPTSQSQSI